MSNKKAIEIWYQQLQDQAKKLGYRFSKIGVIRPMVFAEHLHWWLQEAQHEYQDATDKSEVPNPFPRLPEEHVKHNLDLMLQHGYLEFVSDVGLLAPGIKYRQFDSQVNPRLNNKQNPDAKSEIKLILSEVFRELSNFLKH